MAPGRPANGKNHMRETAHEVLKLLDMQDHQAVIVAAYRHSRTPMSTSCVNWSIPKPDAASPLEG